MTAILVRKLLRDVRNAFIATALLLVIFSAFWVKVCQRVTTEIAPIFNSLGAMQGIDKKFFDEIIFKGPGKVTQAVLGGAGIEFDKPNDFLAVALIHPVVVILACLWSVGRAGGAVSGELERGTMELLLSQPVPRSRIIWAHFLVDLITIPSLCACVVLGTQLGLWLVGPFDVDYASVKKLPPAVQMFMQNNGPATLDVSATRQWLGALNLAALMFAVSGLTMFISSIGRNRFRALGTAGLLGTAMFILNIVGQMWLPAAYVRPLSVFFYYQPQKIWLKDQWTVDLGETWAGDEPILALPVLVVLIGIGTAGYLTALRIFVRRDLPAPL